MDQERIRARGSIVWLLVHAGLVAARRFEMALDAHELTPPEAMMLRRALESSDPKMLALASSCGINGSTAVGVVDRLERAGLVKRERDLEDRRVVRIHVTERGRRAGASLPVITSRLEGEITEDLSPAERETLRTLLGRVLVRVDAQMPELVERLRAEQLRRWVSEKTRTTRSSRVRRAR